MTTTQWNAEARPYKVGKARRIADYDAVRARYSVGETCQEIGDSLGCTRSRIAQIVSDIVRPAVRLPVEKSKIENSIKEIKEALRSGRSATEICQSMGLSRSALYRVIRVRTGKPPIHNQHGTTACYSSGCPCEQCCIANTTYHRRMRSERKKGKTQ